MTNLMKSNTRFARFANDVSTSRSYFIAGIYHHLNFFPSPLLEIRNLYFSYFNFHPRSPKLYLNTHTPFLFYVTVSGRTQEINTRSRAILASATLSSRLALVASTLIYYSRLTYEFSSLSTQALTFYKNIREINIWSYYRSLFTLKGLPYHNLISYFLYSLIASFLDQSRSD